STGKRRPALVRALGLLAAGIALGGGIYGGLTLTGSRPRPAAQPRESSERVRPRPQEPSAPVAGKVLAPRGKGVLWGVFVQGAPYSDARLARVEEAVRSKPAIVMWYEAWAGRPSFPADTARRLREQGIVPMITWEPWQPP